MSYMDEGIDQRPEVVLTNTLINSPSVLDSLVFYIKANGAPVTPDAASAFVTLINDGGAVIAARQAAVIATGGKLSLTQNWPEATYPLAEDYCALWEWQVAAVAFADRQYFDCVRSKLPCLIDTSDLQEELPTILDHLAAIGEVDGSKFIRRGWNELLDRIRSGANRPSLILDRGRLVQPAVKLAMAKACRALAKQVDDLWWKRAEQYDEEYDHAWAGLGQLKYDADEDAVASNFDTSRINRRRFTV